MFRCPICGKLYLTKDCCPECGVCKSDLSKEEKSVKDQIKKFKEKFKL